MDSLTLTTYSSRINPFHLPTKKFNPSSSISRPSFVVFASKDESKLENWELMELKFGRMIGEDPKLTLAKIAGRKANPDVSYLEIEKQFNKKNFQVDEFIEEFQERPPNSLNLSRPVPKKGTKIKEDERQPSNSLNLTRPVPKKGTKFEEDIRPPSSSLNLARPVLKKGTKFEENERSISSPLSLVRPVTNKGNKFGEDANADKSFESWNNKATVSAVEDEVGGLTRESNIPNVILRKPSAAYPEDDIELKKSPRLTIKPNLTLRMGKGETKENFSDITLLKKPEPAKLALDSDPVDAVSSDSVVSSSGLRNEASKDSYKPPESRGESFVQASRAEGKTTVGLQPLEQSSLEIDEKEASKTQPEVELQMKPPRSGQSLKDESSSVDGKAASLATPESENFIVAPALQNDVELDGVETQPEIELQMKPPRLDQSTEDIPKPVKEKAAPSSNGPAEIQNFVSAEPLEGREYADWSLAEYLCDTGGREEVELISCSVRGFVASFKSLIGFLPYRNLGTKWKFLAFESWLRKKGLDPSMYRQGLGIVGAYESLGKNVSTVTDVDPAVLEGKLSPNMKLEDLLEIYDQEKIKFLNDFVGLRLKVNVVFADRNSRKLMFSGKPKEKDELVQNKRNLMAKLNVGDIVKCCIKKITYFGIFVEVEGVPALIHHSEVSWDVTLDPSSVYQIGQIVEAKVHQLDFGLGRITLSLKEIMPDPLIEALESVVGDRNYSEEGLEAAQAAIQWDEVESLIRELESIDGVNSVSKGRFFLSPGLAPTFQVYMASMFQNQYKLLARSENKVQEVIVQASLDKEAMKAAILMCTNRVE